jgi:hypothetical protein
MVSQVKPTTPVFVAHDDRTKVYHLYRSYSSRFGGGYLPACNKNLTCYGTDVEKAEVQGLRLCGHCKKFLAMLETGEIWL